MKINTTLLITLSLALTASCTPMGTKSKYKTSAFSGSDIEVNLAETASEVEGSLRTLAATQEVYAKPAINTEPLITNEGGMGGLVAIDWSGPIEPFLKEIADLTNYKVKVLGVSPAIPVIVSVSKEQAVIADILKDAGLQAGKKANLVVYPKSRIIELRYRA